MLLEFGMPNSNNKVRLAALSARASGRVTWAQIATLGVSRATVSGWIEDGYLPPRLPGVYTVGHISTSLEAQFAEALLYAGPGAMLSHATAAYWLGLLDERPSTIHVSTPRQLRSLRAIRVHARRTLERVWHKGFPTTTVPQTAV